MEQKTVLARKDGPIWTITLNRPHASNAIDLALADALFDAFSEVLNDRSAAAVILKAAGKTFCAGGDLNTFDGSGDPRGDAVAELARRFHKTITLMDQFDKPIICCLQGNAAGAGIALALHSDVVLMSNTANLIPAYLKVGLTPDGGSTWSLPRTLGHLRSFELLSNGASIDADQAISLGLASRCVAPDDLMEETEKQADFFATGPSAAYGQLRKLLRQGTQSTLADNLKAEESAIGRQAQTPYSINAIKKLKLSRP